MLLFVIVFWSSFFILLWTYFFYPGCVVLLSKLMPQTWKREEFKNRASMIIAAHNEEDVISAKVENCRKLDFGPAKAEIIIVSDGSTDNTNHILESNLQKGGRVGFIAYHPRKGKANALNTGVSKAMGDVLIFSDANVIAGDKSCQALLAPFADPDVGIVCGHVLVRPRGSQEVAGESLYMKYESRIQKAESMLWTMVGVDGALFAIRRELYKTLNAGLVLDDFALAVETLIQGKRIVYAQEAEAVEEVVPSARNEFKRKTRIVTGGYQFLGDMLQNWRSFSPRVWLALISHKIFRWLSPFFLFFLFVSNVGLIKWSGFYPAFLAAQSIFYLLALCAFVFNVFRKNYLFFLPYYFCMVNLAALVGFFRFLFQGKNGLWEKVNRE